MNVVRGQVYWATVGDLPRKPYLVVSNNARNRALPSCLGVRITTTRKPALDSIVELGPEDRPLVGSVLCDDIVVLYPDEDGFDPLGALPAPTMLRVGSALKAALAVR